MIACCDTETSGEVVGNGPDCSPKLERDPVGLDAAVEWNANNQGDVQPVDVLVEVRLGHGCLGDVWLLRIIFGVSIWF